MTQNWPNLEKRPPFLQFSSKLSDFFLVKDLTNCLLFPMFISFWEHTFLARMRSLKNGWPLLALPRAYFSHPLLLKIFFWWKLTSNNFHPKKMRSFDENWRNTSNICTRRGCFLGLKYKYEIMGKVKILVMSLSRAGL